eukprot:UN12773
MIEFFQDQFKEKIYDCKQKFDFSTSESIQYFAKEVQSLRYVTEWCIKQDINKRHLFLFNPSTIVNKQLIPIWFKEYVIPLIANAEEGVYFANLFFRQMHVMFCYDYVGDFGSKPSYDLCETKQRFNHIFNVIAKDEIIKDLVQIPRFKDNLRKGLYDAFHDQSDRYEMKYESCKEQMRWILQQLNEMFRFMTYLNFDCRLVQIT